MSAEALKAELYKARLLLKCRVDEKSGCWIWTGAADRRGYGLIKLDGVRVPVGRLAWALWKGQALAADEKAKRTCEDPRCFNPDHVRRVRVKLRGDANVRSQ